MEFDRRCWAEIDLRALEEDLRAIRARMKKDCRYMAVVKANAYGHGDLEMARFLQEMGADWLGVATFQEAEGLRDGGVTLPILILGDTPATLAPELCRLEITQTVYSAAYARDLAACVPEGAQVQVHLKVNTGMNRLGFTPREPESLEQAMALYQDPRMQCTGIFTHFAVADELDEGSRAHTREQFRLFMGFCGDLEHRGVKLGLRHCCNSAATLLYPEMHLDMVRCGIITYGLAPSPELRGLAPLRPILSLYARVVQLRELPAGEGVSYGRIFVTPSPRLIATVPIGYADGYQRQLGGIATALVRGVAVPVVGRVCMDQMMLDVTQVPGVQEGDRVTLVGTDGARSVTFEQLAELTGTIHYERVCALSPRVPRFYLRDGRILSSSEGHSQQS